MRGYLFWLATACWAALFATTLLASPPQQLLQQARQSLEENSYAEAERLYGEALAISLTPEEQREARVGLALAALRLGKFQETHKALEKVLGEPPRDQWRGLALWYLVLAKALERSHVDPEEATTITSYIREASELLKQHAPAQHGKFLHSMVEEVLPLWSPTNEEQCRFQLKLLDEAIAATRDVHAIAALHLRKATLRRSRGLTDDTGYFEQLKAIVAEFPETATARQALHEIARRHEETRNLPAALEAWREIIRRWPRSPEAEHAAEAAAEISRPYVSLHVAENFLPDEPVSVDLVARNVTSCDLAVYRITDVKQLRSWKGENTYERWIANQQPIHLQKVKLADRQDFLPTTASLTIPAEKLGRGVYIVKAQAKEAHCLCLVNITELAVVSSVSGSQLQLWSVSAREGKPLPRTGIYVSSQERGAYKRGQRAPNLRMLRGSDEAIFTDDRGLVQLDMGAWADDSSIVAIAGEREGNWAFLSLPYYSFARQREQDDKGYIYTDRPAYRPGDIVHFRAVMRATQDGRLVPLAKNKFTVTITDPRGEQVFREQFETSAFGTFSGNLELSRRAALGLWSVSVSSEGKPYYGQTSFRVEEYKKPEFEVSVSAAKPFCRLGTTVSIEVRAKYLFGAPVANALVEYAVTRQPQWWWPWRPPFVSASSGWFAMRQERGFVPPHRYGGEPILRGTGKTDSEGILRFEFLADGPMQHATWEFRVEANVTDASRRAITGAVTIPAGQRALLVAVDAKQRILQPGDLVRFLVRTTNLAGAPAPASGKIAFEKIHWNELKDEDQATTVAIEKLAVGASGEAASEWRIPKDFEGCLRIVFLADDPFGGVSAGSCTVYVASKSSRDLGIRYQGIKLVLDKEEYDLGDTARLLVLSEFPDAEAWLTVDSGEGFLKSEIVPLRYRTNLIEIPIIDGFQPNVMVRAAVVRHGQVWTDSAELFVPPQRQILKVEITTDKSSYLPQEQGTLELRVRRWDGQPVQGEFSLSVYDKAIEYIQPSLRQDIRKFFYGQKRSIAAPLQLSFRRDQTACEQRLHPNRFDFLEQWMKRPYLDRRESIGGVGEDVLLRAAVAPSAVPEQKAMLQERDSLGAPRDKAEPPLRTDFRDSMLWLPGIVTDNEGRAEVKLRFPDSLTTWRIEAVGVDQDSLVGEETTSVLVQKHITARIAAPRFLVERDHATISAIVRNDMPTTATVEVEFVPQGVRLLVPEVKSVTRTVELTPATEKRFDWTVVAEHSGTATFRVRALAELESDALETSIPVVPHGIDKKVVRLASVTDSSTGTLRVERRGAVTVITDELEIPHERLEATTKVSLRLNPSLATTLVEALPYLVDYPYGCVEQTMSRFLPAVIVAKTFQELNIPRNALLEQKLPEVLKAGIERLADFQNANGSWGWWKGGPADDYMTAHVMYGLTLARQVDAAVPESVFARGLAYLKEAAHNAIRYPIGPMPSDSYQAQATLHKLAYEALVLAMNRQYPRELGDVIWPHRDKLSPTGLAMLARALSLAGEKERAEVALRNLRNFAVFEEKNATLHFERRGARYWYWWWNDRVEATCMALVAFLQIAPDAPEVDQIAKWLVLNRQGNRWKSTKDTGLAVMALCDYLKRRQIDLEATSVKVTLGDLISREYRFTPENFYTFAPEIMLEGAQVPSGRLPLRLEVEGKAPLTYALVAEYFSKEEPIAKAGHEIFVERSYERRVEVNKDSGEKWVPLRDGERVASGDRIRVTLSIRALNDYEYLVFEDRKPAGCEAVEVRSGWGCRGSLCGYTEFRDQWVAFFVSYLPQGTHDLTYELRAETPGTFHTLPARGYAMYFPDLYGNSDELRITIQDRDQ